MKKLILVATAFALSTTADTTVSAQSAQERLDDRYDRALAAGYKALFLCGALGHSEQAFVPRTVEHVTEMELTGVYSAIDPIVRELPHEIRRNSFGVVDIVSVAWDEPMAPRVAQNRGKGEGCSLLPIGHEVPNEPVAQGVGVAEVFTWSLRTTTSVREEIEGAFNGTYGKGTRTTAVIVHGGHWGEGRVIDWNFAEDYSPNTPQRTWSVAKSMASTIIGAAVHRGEVDVNASAGLGADESDPRRAITIDHALRMATGRYSDTAGNRTDPLYAGGTTVDERAQNWPLIHKPGTVYRYANNDTLAAVQAIKHTFEENAPADFFARAGMKQAVAETDWQGNYVLSSQVWASSLDFLRVGQLILNDGVMPDGARLLPEGWLDYISAPSGPQPEGRPFGYGAGWWLFNNVEGVPSDTIAALGNRGQHIVIVPSREIIIVRRGEDMVGTRFDIAAFTRDVLAALEE
jgi:CubicO group peptidase (beta-lactamase class C family)